MSYDLEHKLIYKRVAEATVVEGDAIIGEETTRIYEEEDGTFMLCLYRAECDLDPSSTSIIRLDPAMLEVIDKARANRAKPV